MSDTELRILALECEGPKADTNEVLDAAEAIYAFLTAKDEGAAVEGRTPPENRETYLFALFISIPARNTG